MPVLSIGGDKSVGDALGAQMKLVGTDVTVIVLKVSLTPRFMFRRADPIRPA
jgi:hypothetical protein